MRNILYLVGAIAVTILILILVFQNVAFPGFYLFFFGQLNTSLAMPFFLVSVLAGTAGALYALAVRGLMDQSRADAEEVETSKF